MASAGFVPGLGVVMPGARRRGEQGGVGARGGRGELAGLEEDEDLFEVGEDTGEDGGDEGVHGGGQHSPVRSQGRFAQAGERVAEGGGVLGHGWMYN